MTLVWINLDDSKIKQEWLDLLEAQHTPGSDAASQNYYKVGLREVIEETKRIDFGKLAV